MRVLLADSGETMRGGQWQCVYLARGLRERGESVRILALGQLQQTARADGFETLELGFGQLWRCSRWADIAHVQDARSHTLAALASACPLVVSRRVAFPVKQSVASRWKYGRAARFIAVSRFVAGELAGAGVDPSRIATVPDGVPRCKRCATPFSERPIDLLALRTGDPMKGDDLIAAASALGGFDLRWTDHLLDDLPRARVFVYISRSEGLGSAALLASAYGTAVIASREGGLPEAVDDQRTGILVDNRADSIASAMVRLVSDPALAEKLGISGRTRVRLFFSIEKMVQATLDVYRSVLR